MTVVARTNRFPFTVATAGTSVTVTVNTATAATAGGHFTLTVPHAPRPKTKLGKGDHVCVQTDGILRGHQGVVVGFVETRGHRIALVEWPDGGWASFQEDQLVRRE